MDAQVNQPAPQKASGIARISGRIESTRTIPTRGGSRRLTLLRLPSVDEFTPPGTVEVQSRQPVGQRGDVVTVRVRVTGYARTFPYTDKDTGEKSLVTTATNTLEVDEA